MHGTTPQPVDTVAPLQQTAPQPRYYRARSHRRLMLGAAAAALAAMVAGALALRTDVLDGPRETAREQEVPDVIAPAGIPGAEAQDDAAVVAEEPPPIVPAEVAIDVDSVAMLGDSITDASADAIRFTLAANGVTTIDIDGVARRRIAVGNGGSEPLSGVKSLFQMLADGVDPDVWVIALGTNDVGAYPDAAAYGELIDSILEMLPDDVPLVWVDVHRPDHPDHAEIFNDVLAERLDERGNATVAPWSEVAADRDTDVLRDDRVHPNLDGTAAFAAVVAEGIEDAVG